MMEEMYIAWLAGTDISRKNQIRLLKYFGSAENVFASDVYELSSVFGNMGEAEVFQAKKSGFSADGMAQTLKDKGVCYISFINPQYPPLLKEISEAPLGLYVKGCLPDFGRDFVSIVGSRRCSEYGLNVAKDFSEGLAEKGVVIVSGMAKGADSIAHRGALKHGSTVAVLGCGVDVCYPAENASLMREIEQRGAVISEYPLGTRPDKLNFPKRNRIISGLSMVLIVVEAGLRSGTLITVGLALEQGRTVMSVPGNVYSSLSTGTNNLIKQGAIPALTYADVFDELNRQNGFTRYEKQPAQKTPISSINLTAEEKTVLDNISMSSDGLSLDRLCADLNISAMHLNYVISLLEVKGLIRRINGKVVSVP